MIRSAIYTASYVMALAGSACVTACAVLAAAGAQGSPGAAGATAAGFLLLGLYGIAKTA